MRPLQLAVVQVSGQGLKARKGERLLKSVRHIWNTSNGYDRCTQRMSAHLVGGEEGRLSSEINGKRS